MFFSASIAFTFLLSFAAVHSAPITTIQTRNVLNQACTGPNGTGTCSLITGNSAVDPQACTNVDSAQSLIMNVDDDCVGFPALNCDSGSGAAQEIFSDSAGNIPAGLVSFSCGNFPGTVNGLTQ
ncbi:hypothetical protein B0H10DRAFT_2217369 [Mycena sp. CBHHK59/15]|nr:hypothetical protein B0H10DRAFT_2217369 [Mycena sp. CBHHK59/15]